MSQTSQNANEASAIRRGLPIECCGLTYYPITMAHYETYISCREALTLRIGSLPARFAAKDYLNAIFCFENEQVRNNEQIAGLFQRIIMLWLMALRIDISLDEFFQKNIFAKRIGSLIEIDHIDVQQGDKKVSVAALDFALYIRPLLAKQNGAELPDESDNIEIVESAEQLAEIRSRNQKPLNFNLSDLIASVAYQSGVREREIDDWTVREFTLRQKAIDRGLRFKAYLQGELSGMVTYKGGNPCPSWYADVKDDSCGTISASRLGEQIGMKDNNS